jgi:hypothetical protein
MNDHPYDNPSLSPLQFLHAVMHDPTVPMYFRTRAAEIAAPYVPCTVFQEREPWPGERTITIRIEGLGPVDHGQEDKDRELVGHA